MDIEDVILADKIKRKVKFSSVAHLLDDNDVSKYTSFASLSDLKKIIPESLSKNENLVPFAANLSQISVPNGNGHLLGTETALDYYKLFENCRVDLEHSVSEKVCGHIVSAFLTEFDENYKIGEGSKIIKEKDLRGTNTPFNIGIIGILYKDSIPAAIDKVIESSDPKSDSYMSISCSWEILFQDSEILLGNSMENGRIVTEEKQKLKYQPYLRDSNGSGSLKDGTKVSRLITGEIVPLGLGLTLNPASAVRGLTVPDSILEKHKEMKDQELADAKLDSETEVIEKDAEDIIAVANQTAISAQLDALDILKERNLQKSENNISHLENASVILNDNKSINQKTYIKMKFIESLASLEKVTDEDLQKGEVSVANVLQVVKDGIKQANDKYVTELNAEKTAVAAAQKESEDAKKAALEAKASADKAQEKIAALEIILANQEADQKFQLRMGGLDDKYELDDEYRAVVASDLKGLSDEDFDKYAKKFAVIAKHLDKEAMKKNKEKDVKTEKKDVKEVVKAALENAELEKETVPNAPAVSEDIKAKLKEAFSTKNLIK